MITVHFIRGKSYIGGLRGFRIDGHAGSHSDSNSESSIASSVCSAVSVLSTTCANFAYLKCIGTKEGMINPVSVQCDMDYDASTNRMYLIFKEDDSERGDVSDIMDMFYVGVKSIEKAYGKPYIQIQYDD